MVVSMYTLDAIKPYYAHPAMWSNARVSGRTPTHGYVHFIVHGRCNELLGLIRESLQLSIP
jgi:hypothetical protein